MKKIFYVILILLLIGIIIYIAKPDEDEAFKMGVAVYKQEDIFIGSIINEMENITRDLENEGKNIKFEVSDGKENQLDQNDEIDKFLSLDYDVLCVNLVDRTNASIIIDRAREEDVPVIFFNREPVEEDLYMDDNVYYVGSNPKISAIMQGELIVEAYNNRPDLIDKNNDGIINYAMLEGEVGHQDSIYRTEYTVKTLNADGLNTNKIVSGVANFDRNQSMALVEQWIENKKDIEIIICNNDDMALGALDAYKKNDLDIPPIVGIDGVQEAIDEVEQGNLLGTVISSADIYGQQLFALAYAVGNNEELPDDLVLEDNKYIWIPWEGMLNELYK